MVRLGSAADHPDSAQSSPDGPPISILRSPKAHTHQPPPRVPSTFTSGSPTSSERSTLSPSPEPHHPPAECADHDALGIDPLDLLAAEIARTEGRPLSPFDDPDSDEDQLMDEDVMVSTRRPPAKVALGQKRRLGQAVVADPRKTPRLSDGSARRRR